MNKKPRYSELEQKVEQLKLKLAKREKALSEIVVLYADIKSQLNDKTALVEFMAKTVEEL